jgi:mRNA-degrading endonuclease toxin of MazEF toxin-antitoxin module
MASNSSFKKRVLTKAKANQIRTVDKKRLAKLMAELPPDKLAALKQAVCIHLEI